jgi:hypothetical protein
MSEGILALAAPADEVIVEEAPASDEDFILIDEIGPGAIVLWSPPSPTFGQTVISTGAAFGQTVISAGQTAYAGAVVIGSTIAEHAPAVGQGLYDGVTTVGSGIVYGANAVGNGITFSTPYIVSAASGVASFVAGVSCFVAELGVRTFGPVIPPVLEGAGGVAEGLGKGTRSGLTFLGNKIGAAVESYTREEKKDLLK